MISFKIFSTIDGLPVSSSFPSGSYQRKILNTDCFSLMWLRVFKIASMIFRLYRLHFTHVFRISKYNVLFHFHVGWLTLTCSASFYHKEVKTIYRHFFSDEISSFKIVLIKHFVCQICDLFWSSQKIMMINKLKLILAFNDNFSIWLLAQLNIEPPSKLTANFPFV